MLHDLYNVLLEEDWMVPFVFPFQLFLYGVVLSVIDVVYIPIHIGHL